jgi:hypothetical protein
LLDAAGGIITAANGHYAATGAHARLGKPSAHLAGSHDHQILHRIPHRIALLARVAGSC